MGINAANSNYACLWSTIHKDKRYLSLHEKVVLYWFNYKWKVGYVGFE